MAPADSWMSAAVTHHEILLSDLAEELAVLMTSRRTADDPLRSLVERTLDDAEEFLAYACDWLPTAPVQVVRMALRVADRVQVGGLFQPGDFQAFAGRRCLVIVDIEGAEDDLLRPDLAPALAGMRLIVETHDVYRPGVLDRLQDRFAATHEITVVRAGPKTSPLPELLRNRSHLDQLLAVWEFRAAPTPWLVMIPKPSA